jgi:hypothetical protein
MPGFRLSDRARAELIDIYDFTDARFGRAVVLTPFLPSILGMHAWLAKSHSRSHIT